MSRLIVCLVLGVVAWGCTNDGIRLSQLAALSGDVQLDRNTTQLLLTACCPPEGGEREVGRIRLDPVMSVPRTFVNLPLSFHGMRIRNATGPVRFEIRREGGATFEPVVGATVYALPATLRVIATGCAASARFRIAVAAVLGEVEGEVDPARVFGLDGTAVWEGAEDVTVEFNRDCTAVARPQVALDGSGNGMIVYEVGGAIAVERYVEGFQDSIVVDPGPGASVPDVAMDGAGNAIAVWLRDVDGGRQVFASVFRTGAWSAPIEMDPRNEDVALDLEGAQPEAPQVALARDGTGLVVWARGGAIVGRRIETLLFLAEAFTIARDDVAFRRPRVGVDATGAIGLIVWESDLKFVYTVDAPPLGEFSGISQFGEPGVSGVDLQIAGAFAAAVYEDRDGVIARRFVDGGWLAPERVASVGARRPRVGVSAAGDVRVSYDVAGQGVFAAEFTDGFFGFPARVSDGVQSWIATNGDIVYALAAGGVMRAARQGNSTWSDSRPIGAGAAGETDMAMDASDTCLAAWVEGGALRRFVWAPPVASFTHDPVLAGQPVTLNAASARVRTTGGSIAAYFWTFGDEDHADGQTVERSFLLSQSVRLAVTDDWGNRSTVDQAVEVESASDTVTLTIEFAGGGTGEVFLGAPQTTCTQTCTIEVPRGALLFLQPLPTGGSLFSHWTGCDDDFGIEGCGLTMNADRTVQVFFE